MKGQEKRHFHTMGLHRPIAHLNARLKCGFIMVDGICGDLDFEEGGNPVPMNRVMGVLDPVLCDTYVARLAQKADAKDACSACYGSLIHALARMDESGELDYIPGKVCIGQGYKGECGSIGVGNCTRGFAHYVQGCPPKASDILAFLRDLR